MIETEKRRNERIRPDEDQSQNCCSEVLWFVVKRVMLENCENNIYNRKIFNNQTGNTELCWSE